MQERVGKYSSTRMEYKGIIFRSRLEVTWALFFDILGIRYYYEPQLPRVQYRPDFWLPTFQSYIEIKPGHDKIDLRLESKAKALTQFSRKPVFVFFGEVRPPSLPSITLSQGSAWRYTSNGRDTHYHWCQCPKCDMVTISQYIGSISPLPCGCDLTMGQLDLFQLTFHATLLQQAYIKAHDSLAKLDEDEGENSKASYGATGDSDLCDDLEDEDIEDQEDEHLTIWERAPEMRLEWEDWELEEDENEDT